MRACCASATPRRLWRQCSSCYSCPSRGRGFICRLTETVPDRCCQFYSTVYETLPRMSSGCQAERENSYFHCNFQLISISLLVYFFSICINTTDTTSATNQLINKLIPIDNINTADSSVTLSYTNTHTHAKTQNTQDFKKWQHTTSYKESIGKIGLSLPGQISWFAPQSLSSPEVHCQPVWTSPGSTPRYLSQLKNHRSPPSCPTTLPVITVKTLSDLSFFNGFFFFNGSW